MKCILFVIIGAGLGHITRGLAVARQISKLTGQCRILFFTTADATDLIQQYGYQAYHVTKPDEMKAPQYNQLIGTVLNKIIDQNQVECMVFDGAFPYQCIVSIMTHRIGLWKVWLKREGDRREYDTSSLEFYKKLFNLVVLPDELGETSSGSFYEVNGPEGGAPRAYERRVPPIMLLQYEDALERKAVRTQLKIPEEEQVWYVQLRNSVRIHEILRTGILKELVQRKQTRILLGQTLELTQQKELPDQITSLKDYPSSQFFRGIDYAVTAAGYNTAHELAYFQVPSILVPDLTVVKDDQLARAKRIKALGGAYLLTNPSEIRQKIEALVRDSNVMKRKLQECRFENGAMQAAKMILERNGRF